MLHIKALKRFLNVQKRVYIDKRKVHNIVDLKERVLLKVSGKEVPDYLQGLVTNDINHLSKDNSSQYSMFLNSRGRVICDSIIYRINADNYFIECDRSLAQQMEKHLKIYRIRKKIEVTQTEFHTFVMYQNIISHLIDSKGSVIRNDVNLQLDDINIENTFIFKDPRIPQMGYRVFTLENNIKDRLSSVFSVQLEEANSDDYKKLRYSLGVGEGKNDLPTNNCFPLENNCDFLHGISFHKGCYIGQELTARTYHTGVIRKRLMPLFFEKTIENVNDQQILINKNRLGKIRGVIDNVGLGLIRTDLLENVENLQINGVNFIIGKPFWWPIEAPKQTVVN